MVYKWKTFSYKTDANVAGAVCEELEKTVGLTPKNLVDASRAENAPLHQEFEWDDAVAAEGYRKQQAALIISNLSIVVEERKEEPVRAFFSLTPGFRDRGGKYESITTIMKEEDLRKKLLSKAKEELKAFKNKYKTLSELAKVFEAIEKLSEV